MYALHVRWALLIALLAVFVGQVGRTAPVGAQQPGHGLWLPAVAKGYAPAPVIERPRFAPAGPVGRPVVAQYYAWFDPGNWQPGLVSDLPVTPYNSDDPATIARHVAEARRAGIDALALSWYGPGNRTDLNLVKLLAEGEREGLWVTLTLETNGPLMQSRDDVVDGLRYVTQHYFGRPNWLHWQGKPVIFVWRAAGVARAPGQTAVAAWRSIRDQVDPRREALWIAEGTDFGLLDVFDGQFGYSIAWSGDVYATLASWAQRVRARAGQLGVPKLFVGTVMPGYDDTRLAATRPGTFARDREDGAYFARTWDAAIAVGADMINITSFNEWLEGSQIEPSVTYGNFYLNVSREWSDRYRGRSP